MLLSSLSCFYVIDAMKWREMTRMYSLVLYMKRIDTRTRLTLRCWMNFHIPCQIWNLRYVPLQSCSRSHRRILCESMCIDVFTATHICMLCKELLTVSCVLCPCTRIAMLRFRLHDVHEITILTYLYGVRHRRLCGGDSAMAFGRFCSVQTYWMQHHQTDNFMFVHIII